nr:hypothetical protein [Escherichia coli]
MNREEMHCDVVEI